MENLSVPLCVTVGEEHGGLGSEVTGTSCVDRVRRGVARIGSEVEMGHLG